MKSIIILLVAVFASFTSFAQKAKGNYPSETEIRVQSAYVCPMHADVTSDKPGKCSKCNMDLTLSKKEQMKRDETKVYTCPMHTEVLSNKAGKCPQCDRSLTLTKKEQMKTDVVDKYSCPMHSDVTSKNGGKCPKCGMALTAKKDKKG